MYSSPPSYPRVCVRAHTQRFLLSLLLASALAEDPDETAGACFLQQQLQLPRAAGAKDALRTGHLSGLDMDQVSRCVQVYADGLDRVHPDLGANIRAHPLTAKAQSDRELLIGAGLGSTATRSAADALKLLGMSKVLHGSETYCHNCAIPGAATIMMGRNDWFNDHHVDISMGPEQVQTCLKELHNYDYTPLGESYDAVFDQPFPDVFLNLLLSYPKGKFLLTTRPASDWVDARLTRFVDPPWDQAFVPIQEPCGQDIHDAGYSETQLAEMYNLHNELVRCTVPGDQLLEIDVFTDPDERQSEYMNLLADFVGRPRVNASFPHEGSVA
eukprot:gb/GFBE01017370.1/.p1 GENE.gb/GFBE01017370.1/~~gb/GFBE01017370.1/.p1  ORF type:complete len:328 (+),score=43.35 gb/GFBE01017370.1/:1-984(+)